MQKKEYRTVEAKERSEDEVADNLSLFGWELVMKEAKAVEIGTERREIVLDTGDYPLVAYARHDDVTSLHYSSLTFVRDMGSRNYPFNKKWGDVYDNLTKDEAYLSLYAVRAKEKARVNGCLLFLYLLIAGIPSLVIGHFYGRGGIFDLSLSGSYGAYFLAMLAFIGVVFLLSGLVYRLHHSHLRKVAKEDLKKIHDIRNSFLRQMKEGNYRPNIDFSKIAKIEYRYRNRAHINHEETSLGKEEKWTNSWKRL